MSTNTPKFLYSTHGKREFVIHCGKPLIVFERFGNEIKMVANEKPEFEKFEGQDIADMLASIARQAGEFFVTNMKSNTRIRAVITSPYGDQKMARMVVTPAMAFLAYVELAQEWKYLLLDKEVNIRNYYGNIKTCSRFIVGDVSPSGEFMANTPQTTADFPVESDGTIHLLVNPAWIARHDPEMGGEYGYCEITDLDGNELYD